MLRIVPILLALSVAPALAQNVTDGSLSNVPANQVGRLMLAVRGSVYLGPNAQLRGLHIKTFSDRSTYVCGEGLVNGIWQTFYFDLGRGSLGVGQRGDAICNM